MDLITEHAKSHKHNGHDNHAAEGVQRSDARATNSASQRQFYASRVPIYPKLVHGLFRRLKWAVMIVTLGIYYVTPWIRWHRGPDMPDQAVLVDFAHERFYFFFIELWPQEVYYITGLLILASLGIFLASAVFGRVWCGYACPQTVWTDLYVAVERWVEGDRAARMRLAAEPMSFGKLRKRVVKHAIWLLIAFGTGGALVFYCADAPTLLQELISGTAGTFAYAFIGILTFTTYSLAGLMREQVCTYMCPWPRIQAALIDHETLSVLYRSDRGEPRGPHKKGQPFEGRGHCIDCNQCVAACPMGIDIREGAQLECINCALCIDACDEVLVKIGLPKGLIAYDTGDNIERRLAGQKPRFRIIRARTLLYAVLFCAIGAFMLYALDTRATMGLDVLRDRNPTFIALSDGSIRNGYTLKLMNHADHARKLVLTIEDVNHPAMNAIGLEGADKVASVPVEVGPDSVYPLRVLVTLPPSAIHARSMDMEFLMTDPITGEESEVHTVFLSGDMQQ
ncbi:MAG: cytochrome c oxidase accessory protein CcoG [Pseudomonadota bacterium]|nr:cytochrome c oxidase accessory protein CcoG [Pseudomonadota bacterium]